MSIVIPKIVNKDWGYEVIFHNSDKYCGKVLHFNKGSSFSLHYHILKTESWYVASGKFLFKWIDTDKATKHEKILNVGDSVHNTVGQPHQLIAIEEGDIFEASTEHFDSDSYRIEKGCC
jgi:mannose-6-phosphate isomerase-like protein (cupin superfamily)